MSAAFAESTVEEAALQWLAGLGYQILYGPDIAPDMPAAEREHYGQVCLSRRLRQALQRLNPVVPSDAIDEAFRKLTRPDVVLFINGLPLAVMELKNAATENATIWSAFNQLQTYKIQIPSLFSFNEAMVISDGVQARIGTLTADREWFMPWRTIEGEALADSKLPLLQVVLEGVFEKHRFLDLIRHFIVFEPACAADDAAGRSTSAAVGSAKHRRDRRRSASQPI